MKQLRKTLLTAAAAVLALPTLVQAQNHYPAGAEGIKAATLPPPGVYFRDYNFVYWSDKLKGGPPDFDVVAYVNAPRVIWMTDWKVFGADYGMDVIVPFGWSRVRAGGAGDNNSGLGDMQFEPLLLSWHKKQWDVSLAYSIWAPTGDDGDLGSGFWSHMMTAGATWYADEAKTWSASLLNRYEIHTEKDDANFTPGHTWTAEFGLAKTVKCGVDVGVVGYWQQQVTDGSNDITDDERVMAVGPEISGACPKLGAIFSLRYLREFNAKERPEGNTLTLTITKRF